MLVKKDALPKSRVKLTIKATAGQFQAAFDQELAKIAKEVKVEGFRPGKAPHPKVLEKVGRVYVETEAMEKLLNQAYIEAAKEADISPTEVADIKIVEYTAPDAETPADKPVLTFTAEVDVIPEVKIEGYKKLRVKKAKEPEVKEDEFQRTIEYLRKQQAKIEEASEETKIEKDMWADISYEGSVDGVKRPDMASKNHPLVVGEETLIPGFEAQLVGLKKADIHTFTIPFPKDYHAKELAGKKAQFTVTINEVKKVVLPPVDDTFAKSFGHDTLKQLEDAIRQNLKEEKVVESQRQLEEEVLEQLIKMTRFDLPQSLVERELERMFAESRARLEQMQFNWDTYLAQTGKTMEQLKEEMRPQAEKNVRIGLALGKVVEAEGLGNKEDAGHLAVHKLVEIATQ